MGKILRASLLIWVTVIIVFPLLSVSGALSDPDPNRNEIVWATGYDTSATNLNPWKSDPAYGVGFMYEQLFGYNAETDEIIPVIGKNYSWDPTDPTECIVDINPAAEWSDNTSITAEDVVYSYMLAMWNASRFGADMRSRLAGGSGPSPTAPGSTTVFDACVNVSDTRVVFKTSPSYPHTGYLEMWLRSDIPIIPKTVWVEIMALQYGLGKTLDDFQNDWFDETQIAEKWKVCSGPYLPYKRDPAGLTEIYKLRDDWWGSGVIHKDLPNTHGVPEVPFIGLKHIGDNNVKNLEFFSGNIDFFGGFLADVWDTQATYSNVKTWFGTSAPYYQSASSLVECVPNWNYYPFNQLWFRQALAYAIPYEYSSETAACGYLQRARQGFIDDRVAPLKSIYNASIQTKYGINTDLAQATQILNEYCYYEPVDGWSTGGKGWYVKNVTGDDLSKVDAGTDAVVADANGTYDGTQVKLGPYTSHTVGTWGDVDLANQFWCDAFTDNLHITVTYETVGGDWGALQTKLKDGDFELSMMCASPKLTNDPIVFLNGYRGAMVEDGSNVYDKNVSNWYGPNATAFENAFRAFEISARGSDYSLRNASIMQEMLALAIPTIPLYGNGFWYTYSDTYWTGWVSKVNNFNQVTAPWDSGNPVIRARLIYNLQATGAVDDPTWWIVTIVAVAGVAALAIGLIIRRRRNA